MTGGTAPAFDVLVLGGGPAGTAAGLTLLKRPDVRVGLVEGTTYTGHRVGESLTPGVRPLLEYLGVWDRFSRGRSLAAFGSQAAWGQPDLGSLDYLFTLHGNGWSLDRLDFDRMLAEAYERRGGTLFDGTRFVDAERDAEGVWSVRVAGRRTEPIRARYLVDATGRRAGLARRLGVVREIHDRLVGIGGVVRLAPGAQVESTVLVEARPSGWWYSAPVPGQGLAVVLMSDVDLVHERRAGRPAVWRELLAQTEHTRQRLGDARLPERPAVFDAHSGRLLDAGGDGWVAVGDALVSHDPLSSTGIPHALGSGVQGALVAADALFVEGRMLPAFAEGVAADFQTYLDTRTRHYQREGRWPESRFWARRRGRVELDPHATISAVGDAPWERAGHDVPVHLPAPRSAELLAACRSGHPVHEAARAFADRHPDLPHQRVILGLQELVERGAVRLDAGSG